MHYKHRKNPVELEIHNQLSIGLSGAISVYATSKDQLLVDKTVGATSHNLFRVFSVSKPLAAAVLWRLKERGLLKWSDPVYKFWPEFAKTYKNKSLVTIDHILTHRAGMPSADRIPQNEYTNWQSVIQCIEESPLEYPAGERVEYHSLTFGWLVGEIVQRITNKPFEESFQEEVADPLELYSTRFTLPPSEHNNVVKLSCSPTFERPEIVGNFESILKEQVVLPAASAISTARDITRFYQVLSAEDNANNRWLSQETIKEVKSLRVHQEDSNGQHSARSLGMALAATIPNIFSAKEVYSTYGHGGLGTCLSFANDETSLCMTILTDRLQDGNITNFRMSRLTSECSKLVTISK